MTDIVKICKKHGELTLEKVHKKGRSPSGRPYYACNLCKAENAKTYRKRNVEKIKKRQADYDKQKALKPDFKLKKKKWMHDYDKRKRLLHGDAVREKGRIIRKKYAANHRESINQQMRDASLNLKDHYVRAHLKKHYGFENPSEDLIITKKVMMLLKRKILELNANRGKYKYVKKTKRYSSRVPTSNVERNILDAATKDSKKKKDL